ncbi:MAG TPA: O-antigen ligase family protein [Candidatus Acidoferrales bacterium]|nr:O-antigen ligase family protein [Candidatus Acidoferrales bacterium]
MAAFAVLAHGAVEPWSETVLEIGAAALLLVWSWMALRDRELKLAWTPLFWPLLAFWLVGAFQWVLGRTSVAFLTRIELLKYSALLALFFLCIQSYKTQAQWRSFVWFLLTLGFVVSLFAILQHFTFNGKLYWVRELQYGGVPFGPFVNRNLFAGLMELLIPPGLAIQIFGGERRDQLPLLTFFTLLPIGALFLSASRGGILSLVAQVAFLIILIVMRRRQKKVFIAAALVVTLAGILISWLGIGRALERFASYQKLEVGEDRRVEMLHDSLRIFHDHPVLGTGLGTLQEVFPRYETLYDGLVVNHSHNDYAEALAETGVVGGLCGLAFLVLLFGKSWNILAEEKDSRSFAYHVGALVACFGLLVHATVDFNFHIPSNALIFLLQSVLATSVFPARPLERNL